MVTSGYEWRGNLSYGITMQLLQNEFHMFSMTGNYQGMQENVIYLMAVVIV